MTKLNEIAKNLRKNQTIQEKRLWVLIKDRQLGYKFRRQAVIDKYIVDFCCFERRLILELDGAIHQQELNKSNDSVRTKYLESQGFTVIRFWDSELNHEKQLINKIKDILYAPSSVSRLK